MLVIVSGSGQMRIWPRISSRSRPSLIRSSWNRMRTTSLVNLLVGWCMRWTSTNRHIQLWTKLEQSNGWICTRSSTVQPLKKDVLELIKESLADFHPWTVFLSCGKTFSLHFPSIPDLSVSSISRAAFSLNIRQIATMLPRIIRVCRLLIRRELR
jgi:hypothetical protein